VLTHVPMRHISGAKPRCWLDSIIRVLLALIGICTFSATAGPHFLVTQQSGEHFIRGVPGLSTVGKGQYLPMGTSIFVRSDARLEVRTETGELLRLGTMTNLVLNKPRELLLHKGAVLLFLPSDTIGYKVTSPLSEVTIAGPGALMMGVTESGGIKTVGLHGEVKLALNNQEHKTVQAGELLFIFTEGRGFSRKVDVELATLVQTAALIRDFEEPLPFLEAIMKDARHQNRRIRNRYRVLIGDAKNDQEFELKIIEEEE
jgi:hypothetical protein